MATERLGGGEPCRPCEQYQG